MYGFDWDSKTGGFVLKTARQENFIASEIRPVFAEELKLMGFEKHFQFDTKSELPICWAKKNIYIYKGVEIAHVEKTRYGHPIDLIVLDNSVKKLKAVNIQGMVDNEINKALMAALVADTLKHLKELYDRCVKTCDVSYIGFSGGKDSVLLLDLCDRALPETVPVVFSDTDMELPDTYDIWNEIQTMYPNRSFFRAKAEVSAIENWYKFGPPSRTVRWCCSVHKSTPAILLLKKLYKENSLKVQALLGVRAEESYKRADYEDVGVGVKSNSQINTYPILRWSAHELWLYIFAHNLLINKAYRKGLPRVGCIMCPEASEKYAWLVNANYPNEITAYNKAILDCVDKEFNSSEDELDYLATAGWQARRSGKMLRKKIYRPAEELAGQEVCWRLPITSLSNVLSWLKTLGVQKTFENKTQIEILWKKQIRTICFWTETISDSSEMIYLKCHFESSKDVREVAHLFRQCINKSLSCVGCRVCEAECPTQALTFVKNKVEVNLSKCIHCLNCQSMDYGCWRVKSMIDTESAGSNLSAINKYNNFGMRQNWITVFSDEKQDFVHTQQLGNKMVQAARVWFQQALLMKPKTYEPTALMSLVEHCGVESKMLWDSIWIALANNAMIVKWFVSQLTIGRTYSRDALFELLGTDLKENTKKGGIGSLADMLKNSPLGRGGESVVSIELKGASLLSLQRNAYTPEPLALLYGLFVMAEAADRNTFSVSAMVTADMSASFVSPMTAFGMSPNAFKTMLSGLAAQYPDFIRCRFAQGLDEVSVMREAKTRDDVVALMLENA